MNFTVTALAQTSTNRANQAVAAAAALQSINGVQSTVDKRSRQRRHAAATARVLLDCQIPSSYTMAASRHSLYIPNYASTYGPYGSTTYAQPPVTSRACKQYTELCMLLNNTAYCQREEPGLPHEEDSTARMQAVGNRSRAPLLHL